MAYTVNQPPEPRPVKKGEILQNLQYYLQCNIMLPHDTVIMNPQQFKSGRLAAGLTQVVAAERLGVSQAYLSQLEKGSRPVTPELARLATRVYGLSPVALPLPEESSDLRDVDASGSRGSSPGSDIRDSNICVANELTRHCWCSNPWYGMTSKFD
jgi:transcriptional regulator with XRE-family HTH domain